MLFESVSTASELCCPTHGAMGTLDILTNVNDMIK